jgi:hypothetical protein
MDFWSHDKFSSAQRAAYLLVSVPHTEKVLDDTYAHKIDQRAKGKGWVQQLPTGMPKKQIHGM